MGSSRGWRGNISSIPTSWKWRLIKRLVIEKWKIPQGFQCHRTTEKPCNSMGQSLFQPPTASSAGWGAICMLLQVAVFKLSITLYNANPCSRPIQGKKKKPNKQERNQNITFKQYLSLERTQDMNHLIHHRTPSSQCRNTAAVYYPKRTWGWVLLFSQNSKENWVDKI